MVRVSFEFGVVIRKAALAERSVSFVDTLKIFEVEKPLGESEDLLTFGPNFGVEVLENITQQLEALGLIYWNDYFEATFDHPDWCSFSVDHPTLNPSPHRGEGQG